MPSIVDLQSLRTAQIYNDDDRLRLVDHFSSLRLPSSRPFPAAAQDAGLTGK